MEHTRVPWRIDKDVRGGLRIYSLPENIRIASVHNAIANVSKAEANALFIVKAVNCHDELLEACKAMMRIEDIWCPDMCPPECEGEYQALLKARDMFSLAIAKAEQK